LCAQVLRAKYYPNGNLVDTVLTGNASSTWQTIEYGLELLKKGVIWRIGNGSENLEGPLDPEAWFLSNHFSQEKMPTEVGFGSPESWIMEYQSVAYLLRTNWHNKNLEDQNLKKKWC
jgi:hypothetical protein